MPGTPFRDTIIWIGPKADFLFSKTTLNIIRSCYEEWKKEDLFIIGMIIQYKPPPSKFMIDKYQYKNIYLSNDLNDLCAATPSRLLSNLEDVRHFTFNINSEIYQDNSFRFIQIDAKNNISYENIPGITVV